MGLTAPFILILLVCLALSSLLAGMEAGVSALSRFRIRQLRRAGVRRAQLLHYYLENPENFLWTIQVGSTLTTFAAFAMVVTALYQALSGRLGLFMLSYALVVFLFYAFCDLLPKMLFRQFPNRLCLALVLPFRLLHVALSPLVRVVTWFSDVLLVLTGTKRFKGHVFTSRREMRLALQDSGQIFSSEERAMVNRVLDLQDRTVRSIVVPMSKVIGVSVGTPISELLDLGRKHPVSRLPVFHGDGPRRRVTGVVNLSRFLYASELDPSKPVGRYAKPPLQLREDVRLEEALRRMQRSRQRMAVVIGFDNQELGVVSLRDILKSIFGEVTL